jgi:hypothetical protein
VTKQPQQADSVIHEDQLLNFLVNALTGAFGISIAGNGDIEPEDVALFVAENDPFFPPETVLPPARSRLPNLSKTDILSD